MNYSLNQLVINNLDDIDVNNVKNYYRYNEIDFYYKKHDNSDRLLVSFHGANTGTITLPLPIFRCYNWKYNMLCISDKLLELHTDLRLTWYLSPKKSNIHNTYIEIIKRFLKMYTNVIFYGSSGGGFPSTLYSSIFHKKMFIQNSQIYLEKYGVYFKKMLEIFKLDVCDFNEVNGEQIINNYGCPSKSIIYCNVNDKHHYECHFLPFLKFINDNNLNINNTFVFVDFIGEDVVLPKTHHNIQLPNTKTVNEIINELFMCD
jgi:hypothetical protein